jgi:hypothetical protein
MFSKRGEKKFAPHRTKAEEHSAKIFLHLMGLSRFEKAGFRVKFEMTDVQGLYPWSPDAVS